MSFSNGEMDAFEDNGYSHRRHICRSRRNDGAGHDRRSTCALCHLIGFFLCLVKMKPKTRVALTWCYTIVLSCVTGSLVARYNHSNEFTATPTDMRKIDVSTTFCESVTVKSSFAITTFKFNSEPQIGSDYIDMQRKVSTSLGRKEFQYWGFYLLKGSVITTRVCGPVNLYKVVGQQKLDRWIDGYHQDSSDGGPIYIKSCTSESLYWFTVNETVSKSDDYYFLFSNPSPPIRSVVHVKVNFKIRRKYYSLENNVSKVLCNSKECTVPLAAQSSENVVIYVPERIMPNLDVNVKCYCEPRVYMYVLVFGIIPFLIGTLVTCAIVKFSKTRSTNTNRSDTDIFTITNNGNEIPQGYINENFRLQMSPPSYDEVQAFSAAIYNEAPPTYDEAVGNSHGKDDSAT